MVIVKGLDLIYEWAVEEGYDVYKCEEEGSHICLLEKRILSEERFLSSIWSSALSSVHIPQLLVKQNEKDINIYNVEYFKIFVTGIINSWHKMPLDLREPDFFSQLKEVLTEE